MPSRPYPYSAKLYCTQQNITNWSLCSATLQMFRIHTVFIIYSYHYAMMLCYLWLPNVPWIQTRLNIDNIYWGYMERPYKIQRMLNCARLENASPRERIPVAESDTAPFGAWWSLLVLLWVFVRLKKVFFYRFTIGLVGICGSWLRRVLRMRFIQKFKRFSDFGELMRQIDWYSK